MSLHVGAQIGAIGKGSKTNFAFERLLARMSPVMALEEPGPRKRLAAKLALARQCMGANVHFESARSHVRLVAIFASKNNLVEIVRLHFGQSDVTLIERRVARGRGRRDVEIFGRI